MSKKMKIRIFDDEDELRHALKEKVESVDLSRDKFDVDTIVPKEFAESLQGMKARQEQFRENGSWARDNSNALDDVSILIVDYDLFEAQPFLDAERIAYLARCFTTCGIIIVLNRFGHNLFDLTLKDHLESFADLDIGQDQVGNPHLWRQKSEGFSPWYWPILPEFTKDYNRRVQDVEEALSEHKAIWDVLGLPEETHRWIPTNLKQFLGQEIKTIRFDRFLAESPYGLRPKDAQSAFDEHGGAIDSRVIARIAAARISKWLEWWILPEQDVLVDAPHLASRLPSLIKGNREGIETWNALALRHTDEIANLDIDVLLPFRFPHSHWLSRPAWFWRQVIECNDIEDVKAPWNLQTPGWFFCEDASQFFLKSESHSFRAETISPFGYRYVKRFDDVEYGPRERFAV